MNNLHDARTLQTTPSPAIATIVTTAAISRARSKRANTFPTGREAAPDALPDDPDRTTLTERPNTAHAITAAEFMSKQP